MTLARPARCVFARPTPVAATVPATVAASLTSAECVGSTVQPVMRWTAGRPVGSDPGGWLRWSPAAMWGDHSPAGRCAQRDLFRNGSPAGRRAAASAQRASGCRREKSALPRPYPWTVARAAGRAAAVVLGAPSCGRRRSGRTRRLCACPGPRARRSDTASSDQDIAAGGIRSGAFRQIYAGMMTCINWEANRTAFAQKNVGFARTYRRFRVTVVAINTVVVLTYKVGLSAIFG